MQWPAPRRVHQADAEAGSPSRFFDTDGDGNLDLLTGQGHGGSGLRFYERDWIEDELHGTHLVVKILGVESKPDQRQPKAH